MLYGGTWCAWGQNFNFSEHGHVAYQIEGDGEYKRIQVKILPHGQSGDLGVGSNGQMSLNFFESEGIYDGAPSTAHSSICFRFMPRDYIKYTNSTETTEITCFSHQRTKSR